MKLNAGGSGRTAYNDKSAFVVSVNNHKLALSFQSLLKAFECSKKWTNCALEGQGPLRALCRKCT